MKHQWKITGFALLALFVGVMSIQAKKEKGLKNLKVGIPAPAFTLNDYEGAPHSLRDYKGRYVVLEWFNHGCPYVKKHYESNNMQSLQTEFTSKGVVWLSICSSAPGAQGFINDNEAKETIKSKSMNSTVVLNDSAGDIGRLYAARTTPHMYVINPEGVLIYQGGIDDRPTTEKQDVVGAKNYVRAALEEAMNGKAVSTPQTEPYGCSVKYK